MRTSLAVVALAACGHIDFAASRDAGAASGDGNDVVANRVFVTSTLQSAGSLGGFAGADALCTSLAQGAGLTGSFRAWVSTTATDAIDRFTGVRGWVRPDGRPVADLPAELATEALRYPIRLDEHGNDVGDQSAYAATGTYSDGTALDTCGDLDTASGLVFAGLPWVTGGQWTASDELSCSQALRLYCFGVDLDVPLVIAPATGRLAFVSATKFTPSNGLASADAACATDAAAAGLAGTFRALLPFGTSTAASRFDTTGPPWVRVDGVALADTAADLLAGNERAPLDVTAAGAYVDVEPITGLNTPYDVPGPGDVCNYWSSSAGGDVAGLASATGSQLFFYTTSTCSLAAPVYCLEM